ncbi:MAG: DNA oxidative demethylase AlkB [Acidobacteriota bacterium]
MTLDLFGDPLGSHPLVGQRQALGPQACVLRGWALPLEADLLAAVERVERAAPFRHMVTPGGFTMSVALTNCGELGWTTDATGYRYTRLDPLTGQPWPPMPDVFLKLAREAAEAAGFAHFEPDACLLNRYVPRSRMSLHQDKNERDLSQPIVSVSLGIAATFLFGGLRRKDPAERVPLLHGDVVVWGGVDRMRYHGITPLKDATHPLLGRQRINFTFRQAGPLPADRKERGV